MLFAEGASLPLARLLTHVLRKLNRRARTADLLFSDEINTVGARWRNSVWEMSG